MIKHELLSLAMAARSNGGLVIAQVKNLVKNGTLHGADVKVPGMLVPECLIGEFAKADDQQAQGIKLALSLIDRIKSIKGISGIHIMAVGWESIVPSLVEKAGFLRLSMGSRALRTETACVAAAVLALEKIGALG